MTISKMTTTKKRGGKTARPKYLTELAKIAPRWVKVIEEQGLKKALDEERHHIDGVELDIINCQNCIVGEAWGFDRKYAGYDEDRCTACADLSYKLAEPENFTGNITAFITHFKKEHSKK